MKTLLAAAAVAIMVGVAGSMDYADQEAIALAAADPAAHGATWNEDAQVWMYGGRND